MNAIKLFVVAALAAAALAAAPAQAQVLRDQDVIVDSATIRSVTLGTASFVQIDTAHLDRSFYVLIENLDPGYAICVTFDANASSSAGAANGCIRIDSRASGFNNRLLLKRWAQNLVIYAKSLSNSGSSEVVILQGR